MGFSSRCWQAAVLLLVLGFFWTQTNGQYETPNNLCGGFFRYITGNINFKFEEATTNRSDVEKLCMWTVAPTRQYTKFLLTHLSFPQSSSVPCDDFYITLNTLRDRDDEIPASTKYCKTSLPPSMPYVIEASVMVIVLKVRSVSAIIDHQGTGFQMNYTINSESDWINATQLINTFYSFGRPSVDPIPYFAAGFLNNGFSTFGFVKANYSNGANYEFQLSFDRIKLDYCWRGTNDPSDFLMMCQISPTGALIKQEVFKDNRTNTEVYKNGYGFFLIYWGGRNCDIGAGGSMQLYYDSVRIS
jgi:hypothetical protein